MIKQKGSLERNGELSVTAPQPLSFSLVSTGAHPHLCKSPQRTSECKFLSIHAPSCLQAATESGLEN